MEVGRGHLAKEKIAPKVSELQARVQAVCGAKGLDDGVKAVEQRNPVIQVAAWEGPS